MGAVSAWWLLAAFAGGGLVVGGAIIAVFWRAMPTRFM
jgi:hypothetical protein